MGPRGYIERGIETLRKLLSNEALRKYANTIFSMGVDIFLLFIFNIFLLFILVLPPIRTTEHIGSVFIALSASLITITILLNAHICKSHILDTSSEGLSILTKIQGVVYSEKKLDWKNLTDAQKILKELPDICFEVRTLLLRYNMRIIVMWGIFLLTFLFLATFTNLNRGIPIFWLFSVVYVTYTGVVLTIVYQHEKTVYAHLNSVYQLNDQWLQHEPAVKSIIACQQECQ